jgi:AdoMet-dependent heme synthase
MNVSSRTGAGEPLPRLVFWEVTKGCNLHCVHCRATATELASPNDLPTALCLNIIDQIAALSGPILVLSGGEPLYRPDIFQLARYATDKGLRVALATNGTLVTKEVALQIVEAGIKRVSISLDGSNADTHDSFRGIPGSFDAAIYGFRNLKALGMPVQINMTIARHNADELPKALELARNLGADALHIFPLVPAGCGIEIAEAQMIAPDEYERILNWFYNQVEVAQGDLELKATCAPRVAGQRRAAEPRQESIEAAPARPAIGATEMTMPGSTGIAFTQHPHGHPGDDPNAMNAMPQGCLAGTGVCFLSFEGEVFPCGHLPAIAGDLRKQPFADIWNNAAVFSGLRDANQLEGKCGCCEFRNICMGCRARAFAANGNHMAEEPFCVYEPKALANKQ